MRSYTLALILCSSLAGCSFGSDGDYQVVVKWLLNGYVPDAALCQQLGIATVRLEVTSGDATRVKTLDAPCEGNVVSSTGDVYGGFLTTRSFEWEVDYLYTLTLLDAAGNPRSTPAQGDFYLGFNEAEFYELGLLDYVEPEGQTAALYGEWSVSGAADLATACAAQRIDRVRIVAASPYNEFFEQPAFVDEAPCAARQISSQGAKVLAPGNYLFRYEAYSPGGALVEAGAAIPVVVDGSQDVVLPREMFLSN